MAASVSTPARSAPTGCVRVTTNAGSGCNHLPTSLPCLTQEKCGGHNDCFQGDSLSHCGFKIEFIFIVVPCGPPIATQAC